ncbi:MAG: universal stress protein [bacterium]|nr:universal stress protein [bacterium]
MAIIITNFCVALKEGQTCDTAIQIAEKLQAHFKSKVSAYFIGESVGNTPTSFQKFVVSSTRELAKSFVDSESDLMILPLINESPEKGVVNAVEANKLIDNIERMVLTVPCGSKVFKLDKIVVPIDSSFETRQKVPYAVAMAKAFGSKLYVIGVSNDKGKDAEVLIKNYLRQVILNIEEKGVSVTSEIRLGGNPTNQVLDYANELDAGMIVIMTEQETNITSFFSGKYSQQMIKSSAIPVLSIHPKDLIVSDARL